MKKFILNNGVKVPPIGFGTFKTQDGEVAINAVKVAIDCGYRHIDTAAVYGNEKSVGQGIRESGIAREDVFLTSKLWNTERGFDKTLSAFKKSLDDLGLEYLDLYLIHWPAVEKQFKNWRQINKDTWKVFEKLYKDGYIRSIGVSNFMSHHLEPLIAECEFIPMVNQIEYHIGLTQDETVEFCRDNKIVVEGWSPLARGKMLKNRTIMELAEKYNITTAQLAIRYCLEKEVLPLPKSVNRDRIQSNFDVFSFSLSKESIEALDKFSDVKRVGSDPDNVDY